MKLRIAVESDPDSDQLLPFVAKSLDYGNIEARGIDAESAISNAKGIVLHALGSWTVPPNDIHFRVVQKKARGQKP